jgi:hypothetical protein
MNVIYKINALNKVTPIAKEFAKYHIPYYIKVNDINKHFFNA